MDKFNIEMLISEVQSYPVLWQDSHKDFKNKNITDNIWKKLGEICGCSGEAAKGKWKNLRDTYRRNLQKSQPAKSGSEALPVKVKWPYYDLMSFIKKSVVPDPMDGNLLEPEQYQCCNPNYSTLINDLLSEEDSVFKTVDMPETSTSVSTSCSTNVPPKTKKRKGRTSEFESEFLQIEKERMEILKAEVEKKEEDDDDLQFFKSFLPFMRQFNNIEKLEVREEIQNVILNKYRTSFANNQNKQ
ncbi:uncharacterized protein LOC128921319 [Zeugodacus cucurbitae]|uniref:uncharacterized protein LOC128921319 n=1 Tax=Zeugodacus cucurbitae TaxID=28588 RepID=UPI0023D903A4|nr:uncharacterized protein LOC128921319 [Zeugodacus cucurbitae]